MAALAYPYSGTPSRLPRQARRAAAPERHLRLVTGGEPVAGPPQRKVHPPSRPAGLRRALPVLATVAALVGMWFGADALVSAGGPPQLAHLQGSQKVAGGYAYVVRPGDTLWSIAARLDPSGDPRPLVDRLAGELHGAALQPGEVLVVP